MKETPKITKMYEGCLVYWDNEIVYIEECNEEKQTVIIIPDYHLNLNYRLEVNLKDLFVIGRQ